MTGVTTRHSEEPYAKSARTVLWEVLGVTRAPTRLGWHEQDTSPEGAAQSASPLQGLT